MYPILCSLNTRFTTKSIVGNQELKPIVEKSDEIEVMIGAESI